MDMDRIYQGEDALWYFNVRGNHSKGPFETHNAAEEALRRHIRTCSRQVDMTRLLPKFSAPKFRRHRTQTQHS